MVKGLKSFGQKELEKVCLNQLFSNQLGPKEFTIKIPRELPAIMLETLVLIFSKRLEILKVWKSKSGSHWIGKQISGFKQHKSIEVYLGTSSCFQSENLHVRVEIMLLNLKIKLK